MLSATSRVAFWKIIVVALCLCVFLFSTHAKLVTASALPFEAGFSASFGPFDADQRMEIQASLDLAFLVSLGIVSWIVFSLSASTFPIRLLRFPVPVHVSAHWHVRRFFRPPPIL